MRMLDMGSPLRKPLPARIQGTRCTDLHCHILPGLDDGARDMQTSLNMARMACESGTKRVFATPHYMPGVYDPTPVEIKSAVALLRGKIAEDGLDLEIVEGSEVSFTERLSKDFKEGNLVPLGGSDFILVELPSLSLPAHVAEEIFALKLAGAGVVLAHPERNYDLRRNPGVLREFLETGVYLQVNAGSLLDEYGKDVERFAGRLLKEDRVHFLGSDAHSGSHPDLLRGGPDLHSALKKVFHSAADREESVAVLEQRVEDLLSGRLRREHTLPGRRFGWKASRKSAWKSVGP